MNFFKKIKTFFSKKKEVEDIEKPKKIDIEKAESVVVKPVERLFSKDGIDLLPIVNNYAKKVDQAVVNNYKSTRIKVIYKNLTKEDIFTIGREVTKRDYKVQRFHIRTTVDKEGNPEYFIVFNLKTDEEV